MYWRKSGRLDKAQEIGAFQRGSALISSSMAFSKSVVD